MYNNKGSAYVSLAALGVPVGVHVAISPSTECGVCALCIFVHLCPVA